MPTIPVFCSNNPDGIAPPSPELFLNGFKPTTIGDNKWLNYFFYNLTMSYQNPVGFVDSFFYPLSSPPNGYLPCDGSSMGNVGSGADYSNSDYEQLFFILWSYQTVLPSKGASASEDWLNNKKLIIPDLRGSTVLGDITASGVPSSNFLEIVGDFEVTLTDQEIPVLNYAPNDPGHHHPMRFWNPNPPFVSYAWGDASEAVAVSEPGLKTYEGNNAPDGGLLSAPTGITIGAIGTENNLPHNNIQPSAIINWFVQY